MIELAKIPNCRGEKADPVEFRTPAELAEYARSIPWQATPVASPMARIPDLDQFIAQTGVSIGMPMVTDEDTGLPMAAYVPKLNRIGMVPIEYFPDGMMYYRVLFHEMGHWIAASGTMEHVQLAKKITNVPSFGPLSEYGADIGAYLALDRLGYPGQVACARLNRYVSPYDRSMAKMGQDFGRDTAVTLLRRGGIKI